MGARNLIYEKAEERLAAWEATDWNAKGNFYVPTYLKQVQEWTANMVKARELFDRAARQRAYEQGTPKEVRAALDMERSFDVTDTEPVIAKMLKAPEPWKRAMAIVACSYGVSFPAEMLDDPDMIVRAAAVVWHAYVDLGDAPDARLRHGQRLLRLLEKLRTKVSFHIPGALEVYPTGPEQVLYVLMKGEYLLPGPLDAMAPYLEDLGELRNSMAFVLGTVREKAGRELTPIEMGMLGALAKGRGEVKAAALTAISKVGLSAKACADAIKLLPPLAPKPVLPKGPWGKLLAKRASTTGTQFEFAAPATEEKLAALEAHVKSPLPASLRDLLLEADGVFDGGEGFIQPSDAIAGTTQAVGDNAGIYKKPPKLDGIFFFHDLGNGDYIGICGQEVGKLKVGTVVYFDHEDGSVNKHAKDLKAWIQKVAEG